MKKQPTPPSHGTPSYWKARLLTATGGKTTSTAGYWAYTQSISDTEVRFHCEKLLRPGSPVILDIQAIHKGQKHPLRVQGKVLSCILLSCGTLYGIDLQIVSVSKADRQFINQYMEDRKSMKLTYTSF
ncbi:hypothetical protein [Marinospirillum alkaliphilum]|uniref:PilZ domain-containing protein n=1 Tax=Marinospirillum alkaliphilum DSM 21637 TaxID=1122209 RepID=A0A1K1V142_9GAMM|nr:hypothetical protein [Marinospirillum alkaliphilum]SFX18500.1 hypothetical protein SAMN02745752_00706 [Marinospirillum alkaliphilum DSM 21637]